MTWLPKKAILPRLPANKFLSALQKLTIGPISFDMTKKTPFCDMQIRWFISHLQTFQYTCTTNLHIVSWCMGVAMLCLGWLEFGGSAPSCFTLSCSALLFMEMSHTKPEDQTTEQAPPTDNHAHRQSCPQTIMPTQIKEEGEEERQQPYWLLPSCSGHHIILQTGLSVSQQLRRMNLAQTQWLNLSAADSQRIHIYIYV